MYKLMIVDDSNIIRNRIQRAYDSGQFMLVATAISGVQAANGSDEDYSGLRDYQPSDPPRRIAWKASAHRDSLLIRESERRTGDALVLNYGALRGLDHEARISRLTAWVLAAESNQSAYALVIPELRIEAAIGPEHRSACLRALALLPP